MTTLVTGAFGCIGAWVVRGLLHAGERPVLFDLGDDTHVEQPLPFPAALDDTRFQKDLGPAAATSLDDGVRRTLDAFARLQKAGRLDARELT